MKNPIEAVEKSEEIRRYFKQLLDEFGEEGDIGFTSFKTVFDALMPIQQKKLRAITGAKFEELLRSGSMISIGVAYRNSVMNYIDSEAEGKIDYHLWNEYALEYDRLNKMLNHMSKDIANHFGGIPLKATIGGMIGKIKHVTEYFDMVISHRVVAEHAGMGWRGKNQLTLHENFSCAIRFATIIFPYVLSWSNKSESKCGSCTACEDACTFIKHRDILPDYRENCRRYMLFLKSKGITKDICGKCIKACYQSSIFRDVFSLPS